jgi:hypothetical protein
MYKRGSRITDLRQILYRRFIRKSVAKFQILLKSGKILGTFREGMGTFFIVGSSESPKERSLRVKLYQTVLLIWFYEVVIWLSGYEIVWGILFVT